MDDPALQNFRALPDEAFIRIGTVSAPRLPRRDGLAPLPGRIFS
jgi:hypothetical protein